MEISMNIKKKILGITIAPVIILGLISMFLTTTMVRSAMLEEIEEALRGTAAATLAAYIDAGSVGVTDAVSTRLALSAPCGGVQKEEP